VCNRTWQLLVAALTHIKVAGKAASSDTVPSDAISADITNDEVAQIHSDLLQLVATWAVLHITACKLLVIAANKQMQEVQSIRQC
jgi:cytochrome b